MRVLAVYYEQDDDNLPKCEQIDVSNERGIWKLSALLANGMLDEIRLVGETQAAVGLVRMLVRVGKYSRPVGSIRLRVPGDESYPRGRPFIYLCPRPEPSAFE